MKTHALYSTYVTTHYHYVAPATQASFRKRYYVWRSCLNDFLPRDKESAILEVGSGVGHNLYALHALGYTNVMGIDYSKECVEESHKHGFSVQLVNEDTEKRFFSRHKNAYDAIVLYDVLEHYEPHDALDLLSRIARCLRVDGRTIISVPNAAHPFSNSLLFADITHKFIYTETSLSQLLRNAGFSHVRFAQMNSFTSYDDNVVKRFLKMVCLPVVAFCGELFWRSVSLSQGIVLSQCKPTLLIVAQRG